MILLPSQKPTGWIAKIKTTGNNTQTVRMPRCGLEEGHPEQELPGLCSLSMGTLPKKTLLTTRPASGWDPIALGEVEDPALPAGIKGPQIPL